MKTRNLLAAVVALLAGYAQAEITYLPCQLFSNEGGIHNFNCTPDKPGKGSARLTGQMEQAVYTNVYGERKVESLPKYIGAMCKDNVCGVIGAYFQGEFVGNAPVGYYIVPRGWYLGAATDGNTLAYKSGTGPLYNQPAATAPAQSTQTPNRRLTLEELKAAIGKDRKYEVEFGQVANESRTQLDYAGLITYQGQQYVIPSDRIVEIIPTYIHKGEVSKYGTLLIPGGYCNNIVCKDSNNETLGVLPSFWTNLKEQKLIPSDVVPDITSAASSSSSSSSGEACYEQKMTDFRKENGDEAMIIHDQITEWQQQCGLLSE